MSDPTAQSPQSPAPGADSRPRPHSADEPRPRPQYGEYATPEEQRARIRRPDATDALSAGVSPDSAPASTASIAHPHPATGPATTVAARPTRTADRVITIALLAYGLITVIGAVPQLMDFSAFAEQWLQMAGIDAEFTNDSQGALWGGIASAVFIGGWMATALLSWWSLRRRRLTWWIPLVGAIVTFIIASVCLSVPLLTDPAIMSGISAAG